MQEAPPLSDTKRALLERYLRGTGSLGAKTIGRRPPGGIEIAGGAERGERPRALIDHSIGPVWEANHVWLIFTLVVLWTAFSEAFASITLTLFVPLSIAALGIVLRGSSFAFRKEVQRTSSLRNFAVNPAGDTWNAADWWVTSS